jgi:hypothetical protein
MESTIFWDRTPCSLQAACHLLSRWYLARLILPWRWRRYVPPKRWLTFNGLHGIISQKTVLFKVHHVPSHKEGIQEQWKGSSLLFHTSTTDSSGWLTNDEQNSGKNIFFVILKRCCSNTNLLCVVYTKTIWPIRTFAQGALKTHTKTGKT